ncbi:MAG: HU family DNA-binding protein [Pseudomonadota bacterium]
MAKAKKAASKKAAKPAKAAPKAASVKSVMSKSQLVAHLTDHSGADKKAVKAVLGSLEATIAAAVGKKGAGTFVMPGLFKVTSVAVAARPKRFGKDPFTGQERWFPAKPASVKVKVRALKKLKDAAA